MSLTYLDVILERFGEAEFSSHDLSVLLGTRRAPKILSELKTRGALARVGRGRYRVLGPSERPDLRLLEWNRVRSVVLAGPEPKAWVGSTAVELWTEGRYKMSPNPFLRIYHLAVPRDTVAVWREYLRTKEVSLGGAKRVGATVELSPRDVLHVAHHHGEPVVPLAETLSEIREHPGLYAGAEALIERRR